MAPADEQTMGPTPESGRRTDTLWDDGRTAAAYYTVWLADAARRWQLTVDHPEGPMLRLPVGAAALTALVFPRATLMAGAACLAARCRLSIREEGPRPTGNGTQVVGRRTRSGDPWVPRGDWDEGAGRGNNDS